MYIMKRNNFVLGLISVVMFLALGTYFCVYIFGYFNNNYSTETAISYTVGQSYSGKGLIVREETLLTTNEAFVTLNAADGEKVPAGSAVATAYSTASQQSLADQINQIDLEITQLQSSLELEELDKGEITRGTVIKQRIMQMNYAIARNETDSVGENIVALKSLLISVNQEETSSMIAKLISERNDLQAELGSAGKAITSDNSGIFSSIIDGFESVSPSTLDNISAENLKSLISGGKSGDSAATGKLVTGIKWYFAAVLPSSEAEKLSALKAQAENGTSPSVEALIGGIGSGEALEMTIERADTLENGECVVVLSCNNSLGDTLSARITECEIIYESYTGIRVSKEAVRTNEDGEKYIYTEKALQAEMHIVEIVYEQDGYYLVKSDAGDNNPLLEGAKIIVEATDLYDGKVITQ